MSTCQESFASLFQRLPARTRIRVAFHHTPEPQVIDLLSAGPLGATCYMNGSSAWPRSFRFTEVTSAEVLS